MFISLFNLQLLWYPCHGAAEMI